VVQAGAGTQAGRPGSPAAGRSQAGLGRTAAAAGDNIPPDPEEALAGTHRLTPPPRPTTTTHLGEGSIELVRRRRSNPVLT